MPAMRARNPGGAEESQGAVIGVVRRKACDRAIYLKSVVAMLHGLSMQVYAEGVSDPADAQALWQIGLDGLTGPWASGLRPDLLGV